MAAIAFEAGGGFETTTLALAAGGGCVLRMAPMMKNRVPIPMAEMKSDNLRPRVSTPKKINRVVATNFTTPFNEDEYK